MFSELMARFRALSLYYQLIHWTLKGSWFFQDHLLAERLYNEVNEAIDGIAEKGIGATGSTQHVILLDQLARVTDIVSTFPMKVNVSADFFRAALTMERDLSIFLEGAAKAETDLGVQNMLLNLLEEGHQRVYLVRGRALGYGPKGPEEGDD